MTEAIADSRSQRSGLRAQASSPTPPARRREVSTHRFGVLDVAADRVITLPAGMLGFERYTQYAIVEPRNPGGGGDASHFVWLQSCEQPGLAFVVTDPLLFIAGYRFGLPAAVRGELGLHADCPFDDADAAVLVVVNKHGNTLTGNLQGPLVINTARRIGAQVVLRERHWDTRVPLVELATDRDHHGDTENTESKR